VSARNILQGWTSTASPFKHGLELRHSKATVNSLSGELSRVVGRLGSAQFLIVKVRDADIPHLSLAVESFHAKCSSARLCFAGNSRVLSRVDGLALDSDLVGLMIDDVSVETSWSELIWDRLEAARFESSFVACAIRDMRTSCALESMLGLAREVGLRTFGNYGSEQSASVSDQYDFDYFPVPLGMTDTLKSFATPFSSAHVDTPIAASR
jgi:hypothetical protein